MRRIAVLIFGLTIGSGPAIAGEDLSAATVTDFSLEELMDVRIAAPTRMAERIGDIAASVTIVSRKEIAAQGFRSLREVLEHVPGLFVLDNTESLFVGIRGVAGGGVLFLHNGVPLHPASQKSVTAAEIAQFDIPVEVIDRVEVVRSPVSTVYGNGAFQGLVNVITDAADGPESLGIVTYGSRTSRAGAMRVRWTGASGSLTLNASHRANGGLDGAYADMFSQDQIEATPPGSVPDMGGQLGRTVDWFGASGRTAGFRFEATASKRDYGYYPTMPGLGGDNRIELTTWQASLERDLDLTRSIELHARAVVSRQVYDIPEGSFVGPSVQYQQYQTTRRTDFVLDLVRRVGRLDYLLGYRVRHIDDVGNRVWFTLSDDGPPATAIEDELDDWTQNDVYQNLTWRLGGRWRLSAGLRLQVLPDAFTRTRVDDATDTTTILVSEVDDRLPVTGRLSAQFDATDEHRLYVAAGTASQQRDHATVTQPEEILNVEVGHVFTTGSFQVATTAFANDVDRIITRTLVIPLDGSSMFSRLTNDGRWRSVGLEFRTRLQLGSMWRAGTSLVAQRTHDREQDIHVGYSPTVTAKAFVSWTHRTWRAGLNSRFVSNMSTGYDRMENPDGSVTIDRIGEDVPGYVVFGTSLRREFASGFFAALHVSNLFDTEIRDPANEVSNMKRGLIGMGRVVSFTLGATTW